MLALSDDQKKLIKYLTTWYAKRASQSLTVGGYAGTGKTTSISIFRALLNDSRPLLKIAFCSYTGKATQVLRNKLLAQKQIYKRDYIGTIHSLFYTTIEDDRGVVLGFKLKGRDDVNYDLIIVDEASMVDERIWQDLLSFGIPIIAVGDHGQLPPINGKFNLMQDPQVKLSKIHRQAQDNPIIKLSMLARLKGEIPECDFGQVKKVSMAESSYMLDDVFYSFNTDTLILCGYNNTRNKINSAIRHHLGFESPIPGIGDRIICLRNNHKKGIFNGMQGTIQDIEEVDARSYSVKLSMDSVDGLIYEGMISKEQFSSAKTLNNINGAVQTQGLDLFDFGYALTTHKAQGSQAKKVILFEERFKQMDDDMWKRWLYTAVTRAEEELLIFG